VVIAFVLFTANVAHCVSTHILQDYYSEQSKGAIAQGIRQFRYTNRRFTYLLTYLLTIYVYHLPSTFSSKVRLKNVRNVCHWLLFFTHVYWSIAAIMKT